MTNEVQQVDRECAYVAIEYTWLSDMGVGERTLSGERDDSALVQAARIARERMEREVVQPLRKRVAELEAALQPFADALTIAAKHGEGDEPDGCTLYGQMTSDPLTFGDLRRAAQALEGDPND